MTEYDPNVVGQQPVGAMLPALTGLRPNIQKLMQLLGGQLEVANGVTVQTKDNVIALTLRLVGNSIHVTFADPQPAIDIQYILNITRLLTGAQVYEDRIVVNLAGFPDPTFPVES